jgi:hypothetical protein
LLLACARPGPRELPAAELLGERLLLPRPEFDSELRPVIRVAGELPPATAFELSAGGRRVTAVVERTERRGDATLVWLGAPPLLGEGEIAWRVAGEARRTWPVAWREPPDALPALRPIVALGRAGRHEEALAAIDAALPGLDGRSRHFARVERARALQRLGRTEAAVAAWREAADDARALGWPGEAARCLRAGSFAAFGAHDVTTADRLLAAAERQPAAELGPWESLRQGQQRGYLEVTLGDLVRGEALFRETAQRAWAFGADVDHATARMALGMVLLREGRHEDALALLAEVRPYFAAHPEDRRNHAAFLVDEGWALMGGYAADDARRDLQAARARFEEARAIYRALGERSSEAFCAAELASVTLLAGDVAGARAAAAESRRLDPDGVGLMRGWQSLIEGDIELADGRAEAARARFERAAQEALGAGPDAEALWRARYGVGRARLAAGEIAAARASFGEALRILEAVGRHTPLTEARGAFYAERRALVDDTFRLALRSGDPGAAFEVADAAQARIVATLETQARLARLDGAARDRHRARVGDWLRRRDDYEREGRELWRLPADALAARQAERERQREALQAELEELYRALDAEAPPRFPPGGAVAAVQAALEPDAALVLYARSGAAVHAFWLERARLEHAEVSPGDLLAPFRDRLPSRLYVVPGGVAEARALHRTAGVPVGYLPYAGLLARPRAPTPDGAVVVADPTGDLPEARSEGALVAGRFPGATLLAGEAATRPAVIAALAGARVFHFAGHGALESASPWDGRLRLAGGAWLTLADVLTTPVRADLVVLDGCDTARTGALGGERFGLAEAFLLAGARAVIAADRPVRDEALTALVGALYAADVVSAPGAALRAVRGLPEADAFRLLGRP